MSEIVCLANSRKQGKRCIAGIELSTGKWVRPVFDTEDGAIPLSLSTIEGKSIEPLDIIDIPLSDQHKGYEVENRALLHGEWRRTGKKDILDILPFCEHELIHDRPGWERFIPYTDLLSIPLTNRRTLQLVFSEDVRFILKSGWGGPGKSSWRAIFSLIGNEHLSVTDDQTVAQLDAGEDLQGNFIFTLSLSQPFNKDRDDIHATQGCYRLVALALPLQENHVLTIKTDRILKQLQWSQPQMRSFLEQHFNKRSRRQLTIEEFRYFYDLMVSLT